MILAAGLGTRMRSKRAKVLHRAGGLALVEHVVEAAREVAAAEHIVVVTGHQAAEVEALLRPHGRALRAAGCRRRARGTRWMCCREKRREVRMPGLLMVLYGDTPLLSAATLERLRDAAGESGGGGDADHDRRWTIPRATGACIVDRPGNVEAIVEHKDCTAEQRAIRLINSGIYCFRRGAAVEAPRRNPAESADAASII